MGRPLRGVLIAFVIAVVMALVACSGASTDIGDEAIISPFTIANADPRLVAAAELAIERFGPDGGPAAVLQSLERGFTTSQIIAGLELDLLDVNGVIAQIEPELPRAGVFALDNTPTANSTDAASATAVPANPATATPATVAPTSAPEVAAARIVSLHPTATELLYAIDAGSQVVAVGMSSTYPPDAPTTALTGTEADLDELLSYGPSLVILAQRDAAIESALTLAGVEIMVFPIVSTPEDGYDALKELGELTGKFREAINLATNIQQSIEFIISDAPGEPVRIYHEVDRTSDLYFALSSASFIGNIYEQMGFINVADPFDLNQLGFSPMSDADLVASNPHVIVIESWSDDASFILSVERPSWTATSAARNNDIVILGDGLPPSSFGPRIRNHFDHTMTYILRAAENN